MSDPLRSVLLAACVALSVPAPAAEPAALAAVQSALEVPQPEGWADELALPLPQDLNADPHILELDLEARVADVEVVPGKKTAVWTYNGTLPGPLLKGQVGDTVIVHFRNSLPEPTTIHWHGLRVPNAMDGAPGMTQPAVPPGGEFRYEFVLKDAGTYWYHPHMNSAAQVGWGLYGAILVEDPADSPALGDDLVMLLSDMSIDDNGVLATSDTGGEFGNLFGREGNRLLVNGKLMPRLKVRAGKPQRWRIINAARSRYYSFALRGNEFTRIGGDNGLAARPQRSLRVQVVAGERLDLVFTPSFEPGSITPLRWLPVDRGYGTSFARLPEEMMLIETVNEPAVSPPPIPEQLRAIPAIDVTGATEQTLDLTIALDGKSVEMGINNVPFWNAKPLHAKIGQKQVWTVTNNTPFAHPFHLHGYFFQVLGDARVPEWKDTVDVPVQGSVKIAIDFDERPGMWMYHCHILDHAEVGMMGHLHVDP